MWKGAKKIDGMSRNETAASKSNEQYFLKIIFFVFYSQVVCRGVVGSIGKELFHIIRESKGVATSHDICGMVSIRVNELNIYIFKKAMKLYPGKQMHWLFLNLN